MTGPEPDTLWIEKYDGRLLATYQPYFWTGNVGNRKARAIAILRRMVRGDWRCHWCLDDLPTWRRADARFCCESCRKKAARLRRKDRASWKSD